MAHTPTIRVATLAPITLDARTFAVLYEYSRTLPTGKTIGKRWRCNTLDGYSFEVTVCGLLFRFPSPPLWVLGEYVESTDPGMIGIRWSRIEIVEEGQQCAPAR